MSDCRLANLVIAGTVKAGTTSLFRFLAGHPDICGSRVKETCYFLPVRYGGDLPPVGDYARQFEHCGSRKYRLESTPGYFEGGRRVAERMNEMLDGVRIIIVLRDPVDRLRSFYSYQKAQVNVPKNLKLAEYIDQCESIPEDRRGLQENDSYWGVEGGRYIRYLPEWFDVFGRERLLVLFFDDLRDKHQEVATDIAQWLNIDETKFGSQGIQRDNPTVQYRSAPLQRLAIAVNRFVEPVSRHFPGIKRGIRDIYYKINADKASGRAAEGELQRAAQLYEDDNAELAQFLVAQGYGDLPEWLRTHQ